MTYTMQLNWKEFNLNLGQINSKIKELAGDIYCGSSANSKLELHFLEEPSQSIKDSINAYWDGISSSSDEAISYKSKAVVIIENKQSGRTKLKALGLSDDEIDALLG